MDPDIEIHFDAMPFFRVYKSGRVERADIIKLTPPSLDPVTGVSSKDITITQHVSARIYTPTTSNSLSVLVYFHGGCFTFGSASSFSLHNHLNSLSSRANILIVSVNYRLAPEHPIPAPYEDAWAALEWARKNIEADRVFLAGESAGANIAHHVAMRAGAEGIGIEGVVLVHPFFLQTEPSESDAFDPVMLSGLKKSWTKVVCPTSSLGLEDHRINPVAEGAPSLLGLRCGRLLVCVAGKDSLRDRGRDYYDGVKSCGWKGEVELYETEEEGHVFHLFKPDCKEAVNLTSKIVSFLNVS